MRRALASVAYFRPNRRNLPVLLVSAMALLGTAHILVRTWTYGAAIGFDATHYLATAENLAAGARLTSFDGSHYVFWPPLFPMLLAFFELTGVGAEEGGRWMNAVSFGLIILVSGIWLLSTIRSRLLALGATCVILVAFSLTDRSSYLMTEPLFILLTLLGLIQMETFLKTEKNTPLVLAAVCFGLAAVTRYVGIVGIAFGLVMALLVHERFGEKLKSILTLGIIASAPLLAALTYNRVASGTLTGDRSFASGQSLLESVQQAASVFDQWITLDGYQDYFDFFYTPVGIIVCITCFLLIFHRDELRNSIHTIIPVGLFPAIYLGMIVVIVPLSAGSQIDDRYLLPVYVPTLLVSAVFLDKFLSAFQVSMFFKWIPVSIVVIGVMVHIGFSIERNVSSTAEALKQGYKEQLWNTAYWDDSEVISWLENNSSYGKIYSRASDLLWYRSERPALEQGYYWIDETFPSLLHAIRAKPYPVHFVLVNAGSIPHASYAETMHLLPGVEVVAELSDGGIYRFPAGWRFDEESYRANVARHLNELTEESGERVASGEFDVFVNGRTLVYAREPCVPADMEAWFFVHIDPDDPDDLPEERRRWGFDNLDFAFTLHRQATWFGEKCLAILDLPDYGIAAIRTGQYDDAGQLWSVEFALPDQGESSPPPR